MFKLIGAIIIGTLVMGGFTAKCANEAVERNNSRYEQIEQQLEEY
jgi:hypothetical protein